MVLLGEIRHWARILFTFTRPYFGTASSMSKTFAVSTYSGGSVRSWWIDWRPPLRSRFSCARRLRISFARWRASIRWTSERSGAAAGGWAVGVLMAGGIGGESTYSQDAFKAKSPNSASPQAEV